MNKYTYTIKNLDCANCAIKIEEAINNSSKINNATINFATSKLTYESTFDDHKEIVIKIINRIEAGVIISDEKLKTTFTINKINLIVLITGLALGVISVSKIFKSYSYPIILIATFCLLLPKTILKAIKILCKNRALDENALISISVIGAFAINEPFEGFMVIALYSIGKLLEEMAVNKSRKSISELMDIRADYANVLENEKVCIKKPDEVEIGDLILIKIGEKIPLDGIITKGKTHLDTSALSGESMPVLRDINDVVLSGSINLGSALEVKVTSKYMDSTVNKILDLVENAANRKAKTENFVSKAAKIYTPIIIILSILTYVLLPLLTSITQNEAIYRALSFLVISCPCAIAISVPLSYFSGIGIASKHGILIKGSDYLDSLKKIKTVVFDKTGTLTTGTFSVTSVEALEKNISKEKILEIFAYGESLSNHPIAKSILNYYHKDIKQSKISNYKEIAGKGITFTYENKNYKIGNAIFTNNENSKEDGTQIYLTNDAKIIGKIILKDNLKETSKEAIKSLQSLNIKTMMFTGDNEKIAKVIANDCKIEEYFSNQLPQDKYRELEKLLEKNSGYTAFVGDGINDAPVLRRSDVGISMGNIGSSSAIDASDVVIMNDDLTKIVKAIDISKYTSRIVKQNLIFSIGIKLLFMILNLNGLTTMSLAVFADVGVTVITILNSIRILKR